MDLTLKRIHSPVCGGRADHTDWMMISKVRTSLSSFGFKCLFLISPRRRIDGLRVVLLASVGDKEEAFRRIDRALALTREHHSGSYRQVSRFLSLIVVTDVGSSLGWYWHPLRACFLDPSHVFRDSAEALAMTIVHEATHARIRQAGIDWEADCRPRVEAICIGAELRLAERLPEANALLENAMDRRRHELLQVRGDPPGI